MADVKAISCFWGLQTGGENSPPVFYLMLIDPDQCGFLPCCYTSSQGRTDSFGATYPAGWFYNFALLIICILNTEFTGTHRIYDYTNRILPPIFINNNQAFSAMRDPIVKVSIDNTPNA